MAHETRQAGRTGHRRVPRGLARHTRGLRPLAIRRALTLTGLAIALTLVPPGQAQTPTGPPRGLSAPGTVLAQQPKPGELPPPTPLPRAGGAPGEAPMPRSTSIIGGFHPRLEGMPASVKAPVGTTPVASQEALDVLHKHQLTIKDPEYTMDLVVGQPRLWYLKSIPFRIQVADESIMQYTVIGNTPNELSLLGLRVGTTVLNLWVGEPADQSRQTVLSFLVNVLPDPEAKNRLERVYKALEDEINRAFPDAYVHLFLVGDKLVVTGEVKDAVEHQKIIQILRANAPTSGPQGAANIPAAQATYNLNPRVLGPDGQPQVSPALEQYIIQGETNIVDMIKIPGEQQVMLRVTVAEVNRGAARSIGLNYTLRNKAGIQVFANNTGTVTPNLPIVIDNGLISLSIQALRGVNLARSLAEPNLVTLNGRPAFFLAGGQFPVPVVTGATAVGLSGVSFVPFGVQLNFVPLITDKDKVRLQVNATVSTRDPNLGASFGTGNVANTFVPGLQARSISTTVEMREGQTLAIGGLLQTNFGADTTRVPLIGDLPILGRIASIDHASAGESELVLLVTPELVHPMEPKEVPPLPGSDVFEPGDLEFYALGRLESSRQYDYRSQVMSDIHRMGAYRHCELLYFVGPHGHCDGR